jgi:tetratricopeptide (TPR) repeat protein
MVLVLVALGLAGAQSPAPLPTGTLVERVVCQGDSSQSYALYLPSGYASAKRWPIIYAFDPFARGKVPVQLYQEAAEKYGYIVVGSNNSRNFSLEAASKSANAIWLDTHNRLSLDDRQVYTTGLSGGARVAGLVALRCTPCKIAGVIAQAAGYPASDAPVKRDNLNYFLSVGDEDFNWPEIIEIRRQREELGSPYRVQVFPGPHGWAPKKVVDEAVAWIHLRAQQAGIQPKDSNFVDGFFLTIKAEAVAAEKRSDPIAELSAYRTLVSDFVGLENVGEFEKKLTALKQSSDLQKALKQEQREIADQALLTADLSSKLTAFNESTADQRLSTRTDLVDGVRALKSQAAHSEPARRLVLLRAFNDLCVQGIEAGQAQLEGKRFDRALSYFQLMSEITPDEPWPALLLADTHTLMGNKKQAIKDLHEAVRRGLKNADFLEHDSNLENLRADPEFLNIVAGLRAR